MPSLSLFRCQLCLDLHILHTSTCAYLSGHVAFWKANFTWAFPINSSRFMRINELIRTARWDLISHIIRLKRSLPRFSGLGDSFSYSLAFTFILFNGTRGRDGETLRDNFPSNLIVFKVKHISLNYLCWLNNASSETYTMNAKCERHINALSVPPEKAAPTG